MLGDRRAVTPSGPPGDVPRIGYLAPDSPPTSTNAAFVEGLRDLGYLDGQNIEIVYRWAEGREERLTELAAELAALPRQGHRLVDHGAGAA